MKTRVFNKTLFYVIKWIILSILTSIVVTLSICLFVYVMDLVERYTTLWKWYYLFLPVALFISGLIGQISPSASGHGTEKVIKTLKSKDAKFNPIAIPLKFASSVITLSAGGSIGEEGPSTQIGSGVADLVARLFKLDIKERKELIICAMSAVLSAILGAPIGGAIFAIDLIDEKKMQLKHMPFNIIASLTGFFIFRLFNLNTFTYDISSLNFDIISNINTNTFINLGFSLIAGIFFGLVALSMILLLIYFENVSNNINIYKPLKGLIGGVLLIILTLIFSNKYLGIGTHHISEIINGGNANIYDFFLKMLFTVLTLSFCGSGGILTPLLFVGAFSGYSFAVIFGLNTQLFSAIGLFSVLAGASHTPLSCMIISFEIFNNPSISIMVIICSLISHFICNGFSVYPAQLEKPKNINVYSIEKQLYTKIA